ncbi:sugar transporter ERD6-like 5 isoform X2 [Euphorbia lathyris]|uniref:sugar transporter ERD6-like 5 isoform X2 n=1 Tax=Euphorbia lathyris TaxID=212925 RepID=UPI0033135A9D
MEEGGVIARSLISSHELVDETTTGSSSLTFRLIFSSLIIVLGSYIAGVAMGFSSPVESQILDDLGLSLAEYSLFGSALTIGQLIGAALCGKIADVIGRRGAIWFSSSFCTLGWVAIGLSKSAWSLDLGRFLMGIAVGVIHYVVSVYVAEIAPKNLRGALVSVNSLMIAVGMSITYIIGSLCHWRTLALISLIPCLIQFIGAFFIPESPRWLAKVGREKELEVALKQLRGKNADVSDERAEIIDFTRNCDRVAEGGIKVLFQRKYAFSIIVGVGLMVPLHLGGFVGYAYYLSLILESAGMSSEVGSVATSIAQILMGICGLVLVDKCGRRPLLLVSCSMLCSGSLLTGLSFLLKGYHLGKEITPVLVVFSSLALGMGGIPWMIMAEIFPVNIKGSAGSLVSMMSSIESIIVAYTFNFLFEWNSAGVFFIYATVAAFGLIFISKLVPETKGRTLEEIQASLIDQKW